MESNAVSSAKTARTWNIILWVLQVVLALAFGMAGFMKVSTPIADLSKQMAWAGEMPIGLVRFIGASELAGALGLLLPALTRIRPSLTVLAAYGLVVVMVLAAAFHLVKGEAATMAPSVILGLLAGLVAWGRTKKAPLA